MEAEGAPEVQQNDGEPVEQDDVPAQENDAMWELQLVKFKYFLKELQFRILTIKGRSIH